MPRAPGRTRDPAADRGFLETTVRLLLEHGYDAMSVEGVASAAGVGKATIYRRYPGRPEVAAAVARRGRLKVRRRVPVGSRRAASDSGGGGVMVEHPNAAIPRRLMEAMRTRDVATAEALLADDVVWHEIGRAEPRRGKDELRAAMAAMDYEIDATLHDAVGGDDHTVVLAEATATRGGRTLTYRVAEIYHIRDGRITERWAFSDDTAAIAAFFA